MITKKVLLTATVQSHIAQFHRPLAKMLHEHGCEVHVAARNNLAEKNGLKLDFADQVFDVPFARSPFSLQNVKAFLQIKKIIDAGHYDFVHTNTPAAGVFTRLAAVRARRKGTCVIYTAHGFHFYKGAPKKNWLLYYPVEKMFSVFTDKLLTINTEDYALASKKFKTSVYHIHGVGANSSRFYVFSDAEKAHARQALGIPTDARVIVNVGELLPNKNQKTAILAMKLVCKKYPGAQLLIAGNGPELENLTRLVQQEALENNVRFLGYTLDLNAYNNIADCTVACSFREGLGLNVIEAMLCGNAVVASNNRGHRELVEDGVTGFLVEPDDVQAFADRIIQVLDAPAVYARAARERAQAFTDQNVYKELQKIYFG